MRENVILRAIIVSKIGVRDYRDNLKQSKTYVKNPGEAGWMSIDET